MNGSGMSKAYEPGEVEGKWRAAWSDSGVFRGTPASGKPPFSIVIPPPNVTGILTMGHVLNNTLQDILIRRKKMDGLEVCWFPGTDHAGIATESKVERYLRESEGKGRDDLGREEFIRRVWQWKEDYGGTIVRQLKQLGTGCDWSRERFTLDSGLSHAVRKVFVELYNKGLIYRGKRMINWCPASKTALSDEEVVYREVHGYFYHFSYPLSDGSGALEVATTRPETMLGDSAVAVNPDDQRYKGIVGKTVDLPLTGRRIPVIADEHADPEFGTGCVKITPAHDPNDFAVGMRHGLEVINVMNPDATMNQAAGEEFVGMDRFECREKVVEMMRKLKLLVKVCDHKHSIGYSERGDVPIEPRVSEQWFVKMRELADPAIAAVRDGRIRFHPERWTKTYFHWMENIKDWCISRQIWWGHRIPAWYNDADGETYVGMESPEDSGVEGNWRQDEDVLDTWFSSWLWPFSIMGWPDDTEDIGFFYPTDVLVTGPDIIFFWVARMIMAGLEFMGEAPFKDVYFTSIIRDDKGRKLSKSLGNSPDPLDVIGKYGADALRFSIIYIAPMGMDIFYSNEKCELGRNFANKLWNASRFRTLHGPVADGFEDLTRENFHSCATDEKWILSRLLLTAESVSRALDEFRFHEAAHTLYDFVWNEFCDWHVETAKVVLSDESSRDRALKIFDYTLFAILKLLHPFMPYVTEELSHQLGYVTDGNSIVRHHYPGAEIRDIVTLDESLLKGTNAKFAIVRAGRNIRASYNIPPSKGVKFIFKPADEQTGAFIETQTDSMKVLMRADSLVADSKFADTRIPSSVTDAGTLYMPLDGLIDIEAEKRKLLGQQKDLEAWIKASRAKLSNPNFTGKAPEKVVSEARAKLADMEEKLSRVKGMLTSLEQ
ncbi:MAG: valine--tRNA ligase [Victivallales bacterium]|nr:valine--tRNA ligase [Victivallales bacterium]